MGAAMKESHRDAEIRAFLESVRFVNSDYVLVCKCEVGEDAGGGARHIGGIFLPDALTEDTQTQFVEIVDVGGRCKVFTPAAGRFSRDGEPGESVWAAEMAEGQQLALHGYWFYREHLLWPVYVSDTGLRPLGRMVVVRRAVRDTGCLVAHEKYTRYDAEAEVLAAGPDVVDVVAGNTVLTPRRLRTLRVGGDLLGCLDESEILGLVDNARRDV
jgi:hypothetical protein